MRCRFFSGWRRCSPSGLRWKKALSSPGIGRWPDFSLGSGFFPNTPTHLACFDCVGAGPGAPARARIQASRILSIAWHIRSLHGAADHVERTARLGHVCAFAIARRYRAWLWLAPCRSCFVYWRTFSRLLAISLPGIGVGRYRKLATGESAIQGSIPDVVWVARVSFLFVSFFKQSCGAKLGWACLPGFWTAGNLLLVGAS